MNDQFYYRAATGSFLLARFVLALALESITSVQMLREEMLRRFAVAALPPHGYSFARPICAELHRSPCDHFIGGLFDDVTDGQQRP